MGNPMSHITTGVSTETALRLVANQHCRTVLTQLINRESNIIGINALVKYMAPENPPPESHGGTDRRLVDLRHNQLPKLEAAGLVEYDARTGTVRYHSDDRVEKLHRFVTAELE